MIEDLEAELLPRLAPFVDALLELPREEAEAVVRAWQHRAPAAIVPDPGPAAMLAGLAAAYDRAVAAGQRPVSIVVCRRHWLDLCVQGHDLPDGHPLIGLSPRFTCDTKPAAGTCTCERAKGPALAIEAVMPSRLVPA